MKDPLLIDVPRELVGKRVVLRTYTKEDALAIHEAAMESRNELAEIFDWGGRERSIKDRQEGLQRGAAAFILRTEMVYSVWHRADGRYLADVGYYRPDWKVRAFEIGYWQRTSAVGHGYVTEAAEMLTNLAFDLFEARRVAIHCNADNHKSASVAVRLGFELEGRLRNHILKPTGEPSDTAIYGMTPDRWKDRTPLVFGD